MLSKIEINFFKTALEARKKKIENNFNSVSKNIRDSRLKDEETTHASLSLERSVNNAILGQQSKELAEIEFALVKVRKNIYGKCELCEEEINIERLKIKPFARYCLSCREIVEKESFRLESEYFFTNSTNSDFKLQIDKIKITNFKQFSSFEMNFSKQINIIVGQNSTGKTSLLQAITLALLKENSPDELTSYRDYINKNSKANSADIRIYFDNYEKNIEILIDRREIEENYFVPFILAYGSNFFTKYQLDSKRQVKKILDEEVYDSFANSIFKDFTETFENPLSILESLESSRREKAKKVQNIFLETINSFLEEYKITSDIDGEFFFVKKGNEIPIYLKDLSEGYRGNVLLITDMLIKILGVGWTPATIEGIVLIDEFDKHLHPRWQSRLVNQLTETFPKIQFIMTTHNPMSILDRNPDEITKLVETKEGIKAVRGGGTKTIDVSVVLLEYFNVESTIGNDMREKINSFNRLKLKKEPTEEDKKRLQQLEKELGETTASNLIYDRQYLKFLEYMRDNKDIDFDKYEKISDKEMEEFLEDFGDFFND